MDKARIRKRQIKKNSDKVPANAICPQISTGAQVHGMRTLSADSGYADGNLVCTNENQDVNQNMLGRHELTSATTAAQIVGPVREYAGQCDGLEASFSVS